MAAPPKSGVLETTSTTGTGAYTLAGASTGYRAFSSADNGLVYHYGVRTQSQSEWGIGTYTHSTRQLSRDTILGNYLDTTSPVNWGAGTKEVACVLVAERVAMTDVENVFRAAQKLNGNTLWLDQDNDTGFQFVADDEIRYMANGVEFIKYDFGNKEIKITADDSGATLKPGLTLLRETTSPAAADRLGYISYRARDSAAALVTYAFASARIESPTAGATAGSYQIELVYNGSIRPIMTYRGTTVTLESGVNIVTGAKAISDQGGVGAEMLATGQLIGCAQDAHCATLNRRGSDGTIIDFRRDNSTVGAISVSGGVVAYGTFTGVHYSDWAPGAVDAHLHERQGTVVCTDHGVLEDFERLALVRPSSGERDPCVYGVVSGRQTMDLGGRPRSVLLIESLGTVMVRCIGPVRAGDLLETSAVPGVAQAQETRQIMAWTLGKATQDAPDDDEAEHLVPAVLYAG